MARQPERSDGDGRIEDVMASIKEVGALFPQPKMARLVRGILERQIVMLARVAALEAELERWKSPPGTRTP